MKHIRPTILGDETEHLDCLLAVGKRLTSFKRTPQRHLGHGPCCHLTAWNIHDAAFTIAGHPDPVTDEEYVEHGHQELINFEYINHMYPGCVVAISGGGEDKAGHWGELMSTAAKAAGAVGAVMDGGCRDGQLVLEIADWSLFARYWSPIEGRMRYRVRNYQKPIAMRGALTNQVRVDPGDWIVGDMDGVLSIPKNMVEKVLLEAERRKTNESKAREDIRNGEDIKTVLDRYGTF